MDNHPGAGEPPILLTFGKNTSVLIQRLNLILTVRENSLKSRYLAALKKHEAELQQSGKLDGLILVRREREAFEKSGTPGNGGSQKQQDLRTIYINALSPIEMDENEKLTGLKNSYAKALEKLISDLTKSNIIEAALLAKAELKMIQGKVIEEASPDTLPVFSSSLEIPTHLKIKQIPRISPPVIDIDLIASGTEWPLMVTLPKDDYKIKGEMMQGSSKRKK